MVRMATWRVTNTAQVATMVPVLAAMAPRDIKVEPCPRTIPNVSKSSR